jgi:hypothetical protein
MPRVMRIEGRAVDGAALHHWIATTSTSSATLLFNLPVMVTAEGARVPDYIERGGMIHIRTREHVVTDKPVSPIAAKHSAAPSITLVGRALERSPVRRVVIAIAGHGCRKLE